MHSVCQPGKRVKRNNVTMMMMMVALPRTALVQTGPSEAGGSCVCCFGVPSREPDMTIRGAVSHTFVSFHNASLY